MTKADTVYDKTLMYPSPHLVLYGQSIMAEIKAFKDLDIFGIGDVIKDISKAGIGLAVNEFTPVPEWGINAVRSFWYSVKKDKVSPSGIGKTDPVNALKEAIRMTLIVQKIGQTEAEFIEEAAEEAFSEALMAGIGGAMRAEAAIVMGFEPWTQPHTDIDPLFTAMADQLTGIYWPNLIHTKLENFSNDLARFWQKYADILTLAESMAYPWATMLSIKALEMAVSQIYQNLMDAVNALYVRVTEMLTIYLGVKSLYDKGYIGKEDYDNALLQLLSTLQSVIDNLEMLEDEIDMYDSILSDFVDVDMYDQVLDTIDTLTGKLVEQYGQYLKLWFHRLNSGRLTKPDGGIMLGYVQYGQGKRTDIYAI